MKASTVYQHRSGYSEIPDSLQAYLNKIGETPLLTLREETKLAKRIKKGDRKAREQMIKANLRLVVRIANDFVHGGLPLLDLISEGNVGLIKAVERFDPEKGAKFSTYASWWIKQAIRRGLANQTKTVRVPVHLVDKLQRMRRIAYQLTEELGREPTDDELALEMETSAAKIRLLKQINSHPLSLNVSLLPFNEGSSLSEIIGDNEASDPGEILSHQDMQETVADTMQVLDDREKHILSLRFGLKGNKEHTLDEVGRKFRVTRERIRQLQNIALKKLKRAIQKKDRAPLHLQSLPHALFFPQPAEG